MRSDELLKSMNSKFTHSYVAIVWGYMYGDKYMDWPANDKNKWFLRALEYKAGVLNVMCRGLVLGFCPYFLYRVILHQHIISASKE